MGRPENESREVHQAKVAELGRAYAEALLPRDEVAAEIAIREAMEAGLNTAEIDDEIIAPALWLVGDLWERGEISVADEHLATEISIRVLALQREAERVARTRGESPGHARRARRRAARRRAADGRQPPAQRRLRRGHARRRRAHRGARRAA